MIGPPLIYSSMCVDNIDCVHVTLRVTLSDVMLTNILGGIIQVFGYGRRRQKYFGFLMGVN